MHIAAGKEMRRAGVIVMAMMLCTCRHGDRVEVVDTIKPDPAAPRELLKPMTPDQYETARGLKPVRDSADAVARVFGQIAEFKDWSSKWSSKRVSSMTRNSLGYRLTVVLQDSAGVPDTVVFLVKRNGAVWFLDKG